MSSAAPLVVIIFLWDVFTCCASAVTEEQKTYFGREHCHNAQRWVESVVEPTMGLLARSHAIRTVPRWTGEDALDAISENSHESLVLEQIDGWLRSGSVSTAKANRSKKLCSSRSELLTGFLQALSHMAPIGIISSVVLLGVVAWVKAAPVQEEKKRTTSEEVQKAPQEQTIKQTSSGGGTPSVEIIDASVPAVLRYLIIFGNAMVMLNFTIIMPTSHEVAHKGGASLGFSGLVIGIYGIGAIASLPFMVYWSKHSYRQALLFISLCVIFGNGLYAFATVTHAGWLRNSMLILARLVCGWEGGIILVFSSMINHCGKGTGVHDAYAQLVVGASAGLLLGPLLSSIINVAFGKSCPYPDVLPALAMVVYAVFYGFACFFCCPTQENVPECAPEKRVEDSGHATSTVPDYRLREGYLWMLLTSNMIFTRFCQRIAWESGALFIIAVEYELGSTTAGLLIPLPLLGLLLLPLWAGRLFHRLGMLGYFQVTKLMEVVGLLLMIRISGPTWFSLAQFMVGSSLFYMGNWGQAVPYGGCSIAFAIPNHWLLDLDIMNGLVWIFGFAGAFVGPVIIRALLENCLHQAMIPMTLSMLLVGFWVGQTAGFQLLAARKRL
jgi:MFS family permease